jgi:hypothetical protein
MKDISTSIDFTINGKKFSGTVHFVISVARLASLAPGEHDRVRFFLVLLLCFDQSRHIIRAGLARTLSLI